MEKNNKKKKVLLGCLFGVLAAGAITTAVVVPLKCCSKENNNDPVPSKHGFTIEGSKHEVKNGIVKLTIICNSQDTHDHTLKNIVLMVDKTEVSDKVDSETMKNNKVEIKFATKGLKGGENKVNVQFTVDDSTETEVIKNVIIINADTKEFSVSESEVFYTSDNNEHLFVSYTLKYNGSESITLNNMTLWGYVWDEDQVVSESIETLSFSPNETKEVKFTLNGLGSDFAFCGLNKAWIQVGKEQAEYKTIVDGLKVKPVIEVTQSASEITTTAEGSFVTFQVKSVNGEQFTVVSDGGSGAVKLKDGMSIIGKLNDSTLDVITIGTESTSLRFELDTIPTATMTELSLQESLTDKNGNKIMNDCDWATGLSIEV